MKKKWCWVAKQNSFDLWNIFLVVGETEYPLKDVQFGTEVDVKNVLPKGKIVFVHKGDK